MLLFTVHRINRYKTPYTLLIPVFINFHHSGSSSATLSSTAVIRVVTNLVLLRVGDQEVCSERHCVCTSVYDYLLKKVQTLLGRQEHQHLISNLLLRKKERWKKW